jgi:hypothetical protein
MLRVRTMSVRNITSTMRWAYHCGQLIRGVHWEILQMGGIYEDPRCDRFTVLLRVRSG